MESSHLALPTRHATRVHRYTMAQVVEYTHVDAAHITRWAKADIIAPVAGGGSQGIRREYSVRNLVEVVCLDKLYSMGVSEPAFEFFLELLHDVWAHPTMLVRTQEPRGLRFRDAPFLWFGVQTVLDGHESRETLVLAPCDLPAIERYLTGDLGTNLPRMAQSGIVLPFAQYTRDVEERTGDVLVWG